MPLSQSTELGHNGDAWTIREVRANGLSMKIMEVEAKLDEGNIQEAESSLRVGLSLNLEEARALLGRLEYQRGNVEGALRVFEGIDLQAAIDRLQPSTPDKATSRKGHSRTDSVSVVSQHSASLMLEAIYLKAKSLQKLDRPREAANECKTVIEAIERIFYQGMLDADPKLQETVSRAVELLPELWKQADCYPEAIASYRRALLGQWNLDNECCARIQKGFTVFLLYSGVEAGPPSLSAQIEGSFIPRNNLEEAILLLMILLRKFNLGIIKWDPSVMEHLSFALSICSQTPVLAKQFEEIMPGVYHRIDRWNRMALCCSATGQNETALSLLKKSLHRHERPEDLTALLLAAKICSDDSSVAIQGVEFARRAVAVAVAHEKDEHLKGVALRVLGLCLARRAKVSPSDSERSRLLSEALKSMEASLVVEPHNSDLIFELGLQYAEQRNLSAALRFAEQFIDMTGGSVIKGWRLLALILSAQQRFSEAGVVTEAALDATAKWDQAPILRIKARMMISQSLPLEAVETYRYLLALVQARRKSFGSVRSVTQAENDKDNEFEVWHGLAGLYFGLSHWKDAEICLAKARESKQFSAEALHAEGIMLERRGQILEALVAYMDALLLEPNYVPCKVLIGAILRKMGPSSLPVARGLLSDALRIDPTNVTAWYYLGLVHKDDGRLTDAADCFLAASMLEESDPIESFATLV